MTGLGQGTSLRPGGCVGFEERGQWQVSESLAGDWPHCSGARKGLGSWPGGEPGGAGAVTRENWGDKEEATANAGAAALREGEEIRGGGGWRGERRGEGGGRWRGGGVGEKGRRGRRRGEEERGGEEDRGEELGGAVAHAMGTMLGGKGRKAGHTQSPGGQDAPHPVLRRKREEGKRGLSPIPGT